jgi:hypothetical protein
MERFISLVKRYPIPIAGAVLLVVIAVWYLSGDDETGDSVSRITSYGPDPYSVMANRDVNIAEKEMNAAAARNAAMLDALEIQGKYSVQLAAIDGVNYERALNTSRSISEIEANRDVSLVKTGGEATVNLATVVTGAATSQAQIAANTTTSIAQIGADLQRWRDNTAANLEVARINALDKNLSAARSAQYQELQLSGENVLRLEAQRQVAASAYWQYPDVLTAMLGQSNNY